jgi:hypothetical protein
LELIEEGQARIIQERELYKAKFIGLTNTDEVSQETRRLYDQLNYENELDIKDFKDINTHKRDELKRMHRKLAEAQNENKRLKDKIQKDEREGHNIKSRINGLIKSREEKIFPLIAENEELAEELESLQKTRRTMVEDYLTSSIFPEEYLALNEEFNEENELNIFLKKGREEQEITLEALRKVHRSQEVLYRALETQFEEFEQKANGEIEMTHGEIEDYKTAIQQSNKEIEKVKESLSILKDKFPKIKQNEIEFDDKLLLEDVCQKFVSSIEKQIKVQDKVLKGPTAVSVNLNFEREHPEELISITEQVSDMNSEVNLVQLSLNQLFRDRKLLDKKYVKIILLFRHSLVQTQKNDISTISNVAQNLLKNNQFASEELNSLKISNNERMKILKIQEKTLKKLHKKSLGNCSVIFRFKAKND